jgi:hypothetical protein
MISPPMPHKQFCEELNRIKLEAVAALHSARQARRSHDVSFHEDVELTRDEHQKIDALLKHLLVGHDGHPCPAGDRPIVGIVRPAAGSTDGHQTVQAEASHPLRTFALRHRRQ